MSSPARANSFYTILTEAIAEITDTGFHNAQRLAYWVDRIRKAAAASMTPLHMVETTLNKALRGTYTAKIERRGILTLHPGVSRFTLANVRPKLHAELERRLLASRSLIKLNRDQAIETTVRRFSGWAMSVPDGGSDVVDKQETKAEIRKSLASLPFVERRVAIDQGHKFVANLSNIIASDGGAIAMVWNSQWRQRHYNYREDHKERDGNTYLLRNTWATERGLVKPSENGHYDSITSVGEEVYCRCYAKWVYSLSRLPPEMLTAKGRAEMERVAAA